MGCVVILLAAGCNRQVVVGVAGTLCLQPMPLVHS